MKNNLAFMETGEGLPIILLHGFCESKEIWEPIFSDIGENGRTLAIDLPGFGNNKPLQNPITIPQMADQVCNLLQYLKLESVVVIGHSLGGYVALALAEKFPDFIKGLCLFHSTAFADSSQKKENRDKTIAFLENNGTTPFIENFVPSLFYENNRTPLENEINKVIAEGEKTSPQTAVEVTKAMRDRKDRSRVLKEENFPVLFFAGKEDQAVPVEALHQQCQATKGPTTFHAQPNTAHMGMYECPNTSAAIISGFINSIC